MDLDPLLVIAEDLGTVSWFDGEKEFRYSRDLEGIAGQCVEHDNIATIVETEQDASATVEVCAEAALELDKTVTATYERTYHWSLDKVARQLDDVEVTDGSTGTFDYTVEVTPQLPGQSGHDDHDFAMHGTITVTNPNYQVYNGVDITVTKRYSDRWQLAGGVTIQDSPLYFPVGSSDFSNPTGRIYRDGVSTLAKYVLKLNGSYELPWGIVAAGNLNMFQGASRTLTMDGPGNVYGGVNAAGNPTTISYTTLEFQNRNETRIEDTKMLDLGVQYVLRVGPGEKYQVRFMADLFNVFNVNTVLSYASGNVSTANATAPSSIIPPRVLRLGVRMLF